MRNLRRPLSRLDDFLRRAYAFRRVSLDKHATSVVLLASGLQLLPILGLPMLVDRCVRTDVNANVIPAMLDVEDLFHEEPRLSRLIDAWDSSTIVE